MLRWVARFAVLVGVTIALWAAPRGASWAWQLPSASPHVAIGTVISTRAVPVAIGFGLLIALIALFLRRWFCRWLCPTGTCLDACSRLGRRGGRRSLRLPPIGQWIVLATLGGACLGYPLFLWLDPLAIFSAPFTWAERQPGDPVCWTAAILPALLVLSVVVPHLWCQRLCPLGSLQDLLSRPVLALRRARPESEQMAARDNPLVTGRRAALFGLVGIAGAAFVERRRAAAGRQTFLRPPGARDELQFTGLCIRCGHCTRACPTGIIHSDSAAHGIAGWLAPIVRFDRDYCREDCVRCTGACPTGALLPVALQNKQQARIGFPRVDMEICLLGDARECAICRSHCPFEAIRLQWDEETYTLTPVVDPARCPGCGACQVACPTQPDKAIVVEPLAT